jgi:hypothetical protein
MRLRPQYRGRGYPDRPKISRVRGGKRIGGKRIGGVNAVKNNNEETIDRINSPGQRFTATHGITLKQGKTKEFV